MMDEEDKKFKDLDEKIEKLSEESGIELEHERQARLERESRKVDVAKSGIGAGFEFAAAVIICMLVGVWADRQFDMAPLWMLIGMFLGITVAFYNLYRASQNL
jgi:F0F1-type ATP synthase assembly protein I